MAAKKTNAEWKAKLSPDVYRITREKGTERPFTGEYNDHKAEGEYMCRCCGAKLFESEAKFNSGCGWPAFSKAAGADGRDDSMTNIARHNDSSHGMTRVEVTCKECDAHLGHVFEDGPAPTGIRYCINSASINFKGK